MAKILWKTEKRKIKDLKPFEGNPRIATEKDIEDLDQSLKRFDVAEPLVINTDGEVIGGNFRLSRIKEMGIEEVDVRVPDRTLTRKEAEELNLRLNKNTARWDYNILANFDEDILKDVGFAGEELDDIFGLERTDDFDVEKEIKRVLKEKERRCTYGDLWQLGKHRLVIGDATCEEDWKRALNSDKFDMLFTDPPYRLAYTKGRTKKVKTKEGFKRVGETDKAGKKKGFGYKGNRVYLGTETTGGVPEFDQWLSIANKYQNEKGVNIMIFENWKNVHDLWEAIEKYWKIQNMIIWWLPNRMQGFSTDHKFFNKYDIAPLAGNGEVNEKYEIEFDRYLQEHGQKLLDAYEVILYAKQGDSEWDRRKGTPWARVSDHITSAASTEKSGGQNVVFGTKPIPILVPYVKILSPRNGIIMDPFAGSGSTMIASEIMKRRCCQIEKEPIYAEVILSRFERFTGIKATLVEKGAKMSNHTRQGEVLEEGVRV